MWYHICSLKLLKEGDTMGDKLANVLIVFIMVVILGLGGLYYAKVVGSHSYAAGNNISYGEMIQGNSINTNISTLNDYSEENRVTIDMTVDNNQNNIYSKNNQSGYKYNNRYYYNSLNDYSKAIYDAIANNIDKLKTGNATIEIDYDFTTLLNNGNGDKQLNDYYDDAVNAINLDIPNLFYIDFSKMWLNIERSSSIFSTTYKLFINSGHNSNYLVEQFSTQQQVEIAASQVESAKNQVKTIVTGSDYTKAKNLHDWLIEYMQYDSSNSQKATVYGSLIEKKGVCESYARTYKYILDEVGIENVLVTGKATNSNGMTEDHMWNYVKVNGKWYAVDATWDDPIVVGNGNVSDEVKHRYFLKGSQEFFKNHTEKLTISESGKIFNPPKLESDNY